MGRLACAISAAARRTADCGSLGASLPDWRRARSAASLCCEGRSRPSSASRGTASCTSLGKSTSTGPGRPWRVSSKARATTFATSSTARIWVFHLVTEREMPMASHSWKASVPIAAVATCPLMHSTGIESHMASSRPEVVLAMPGPEVTNTTPGRPVVRA